MVEVLKMGLQLWRLRAAAGMEMTRNICRVPSYEDVIQAIVVPKVFVMPATGLNRLIGFSRESRRTGSHFGNKNSGVDPDRLSEFCL